MTENEARIKATVRQMLREEIGPLEITMQVEQWTKETIEE